MLKEIYVIWTKDGVSNYLNIQVALLIYYVLKNNSKFFKLFFSHNLFTSGKYIIHKNCTKSEFIYQYILGDKRLGYHIRYTDHFKQVGVSEKHDRNEINSVDGRCLWLCVRVTLSSIGKVLG